MAKIKPLSKKHRFTRWLKRLLGIQSPSARIRGFQDIDEMHTYKPTLRLEPIRITAEVVDDYCFDGIPLTEAEMKARVQRALAEKLTREIIEHELFTIQTHEDPINFKKRYRATLTVYSPNKEEPNDAT